MPKPVRYRTKLMQYGIFLVQYRTKIRDAGMPMPALVSSMPMPSYGNWLIYCTRKDPVWSLQRGRIRIGNISPRPYPHKKRQWYFYFSRAVPVACEARKNSHTFVIAATGGGGRLTDCQLSCHPAPSHLRGKNNCNSIRFGRPLNIIWSRNL
jgi:hypothetical protein